MDDDTLLRIAGLIIAIGGAYAVFHRYVFAPLARLVLRLVAMMRKALDDIAELLAQVADLKHDVEEIKDDVSEAKEDIAEIKGALKARDIL